MARRPRWGLMVALFVLVTAVVLAVAVTSPFSADAPSTADVPPGDASSGATVFAQRCQACHGPGGATGGVGPVLTGRGLDAGRVAGVIATGRGVMPAGLVSGRDAADVTAYVVGISGGAPATAPATATAPGAAAPGGTVRLAGRDLTGIVVRLDAPSPTARTVWVDGDGGLRRVGTIAAGEDRLVAGDAGGGLIGAYDRVLVGTDPAAPGLVGAVGPARAEALRRLLVDDPRVPGGAATIDAAAGQVAVMREHIRFLGRALRERNLANIRFHGEHMVNIAGGDPPEDVDGNGDPSNPGDGVGLVGRGGYLPRIAALGGDAVRSPTARLGSVVAGIARDGRRAGTSTDVDAAAPAVLAIVRRDAALAAGWRRVRARAAAAATIPLEAP